MVKYYLFLCLYLACFSTQAQIENTLLWEVSGNGLEKSSYLYGTMHLQDERVFDFSDSVKAKINACDAMALEIVFEDDLMGMMDPEMMGSIMMPDGTQLEDLMANRDFKKVKAVLKNSSQLDKLGPLAGLLINRIKPIWLSMILTEDQAAKDRPLALDMHLQKEAEGLGKMLISIETVSEQMQALDEISLDEQAQMLVDQVNNLDAAAAELEQMIEAYQKEDLQLIDSMTNATMADYSNFDDELLIKRNKRMVERSSRIIKEQSTFIAVGTAHLLGETGLVNALREMGYNVFPVFAPNKHTAEQIESAANRDAGKYLTDFQLLTRWMTGSFNSSAQAQADSSYFNISLEMHPIWADNEDGKWIYVEQAVVGSEDKPYRQRVYHLREVDGVFISDIYKLPNAKLYINQFGNRAMFSLISPKDLNQKVGCEVILRKEGDQFMGSTGERSCPSTLRGATYATSEVTVTENQMISWDRGYSEDEEQVWGAEKGAYIFDRLQLNYE